MINPIPNACFKDTVSLNIQLEVMQIRTMLPAANTGYATLIPILVRHFVKQNAPTILNSKALANMIRPALVCVRDDCLNSRPTITFNTTVAPKRVAAFNITICHD